MKRLRARIATAMLGVLLVLGGAAMPVPAAVAAESCYGDYCSGKDPSRVGVGGVPCADRADTVRSARVNMSDGFGGYYEVGTLEVRWSARCQTNWARLSLERDAYGILGINILQDTGYKQYKSTRGFDGGTSKGVFWTNMIYSPTARVMAYLHHTWPSPCTVCATEWV